jgi:crossover junction endodeoxyribonuclease RusA
MMRYMLRLTMPFPPQANHIFTVARGRKIMASKYRLWRDLAASELLLSKPGKVHGPFAITIRLDRPDRRKRDIDNLAKGLLDSLTLAGVIEDDSLCQRLVMEWTGSIGKPAFAYVEIEEWNETASSQSANVVQMRPSRSGDGVSDKTG